MPDQLYTSKQVAALRLDQTAQEWLAADPNSPDEERLAESMHFRIRDLVADGFEAELTDALDYVYKVMQRYTNAGKNAPEPMRDPFGVLKKMEAHLGPEKS